MLVHRGAPPSIMIIASGGKAVGWGHVMRCSSIAEVLIEQGCNVIFGALNDEVAALATLLGFESTLLGVDSLSSREEADHIKRSALQHENQVIMVDSYEVCQAFFQELQSDQYRVAYIDDLFLYNAGFLGSPKPYAVDILVNYGFGAHEDSYSSTYSSSDTDLLIGPSFAPVRPAFAFADYAVQCKANRVLLTSGSTNPNHALEKMMLACKELGGDIEINVVVGRNGSLDIDCGTLERCVVHEGVSDLSSLMKQADIVVSSAGSTLYELACVGVPTIALPVVDNQLSNARGFFRHDLGYGCSCLDWDSDELGALLRSMADDFETRKRFSARMRRIVDGMGAVRIANTLISSS